MRTRIGLEDEVVDVIVGRLSLLLADIHQLYVKVLAYHWNVEDSRFYVLHELFEEMYKQLAADLDAVAERIRKLGRLAPATIVELTQLKRLTDTEKVTSGDRMIEQLAADYEQLIIFLREDISVADERVDIGTADMLTGILRQYEKNDWLLRSHLME